MFQVEHNPDQLIARTRFVVQNAKRCEQAIRDFMEVKRPLGLRIRHACDRKTGTLELSARWSEPLRIMVRHLKDCGLLRGAKELRI